MSKSKAKKPGAKKGAVDDYYPRNVRVISPSNC
jgi:hypothetical protein